MPEPASGGRRRTTDRRRRLPSPLTVLAAVIPLATVGALAVVRPAPVPDPTRDPVDAPLVRSTLVCPAALPDAQRVWLGSSSGAAGDLASTTGGDEGTVPLVEGAGTLTEDGPAVLTGEGDLAPGLLATRAGDGAAVLCAQPRPAQWFTGLAAGPERSSVLFLTNPDRGPAVADVTVVGEDGPLDVPELRGVRVAGGRTTTVDLAEVVPTRAVLTVGVSVSRGRLGVHVVDVDDPVGEGPVAREWVPVQAEPRATSYVVGLGGRPGDRLLTLANPGDREVRAEVRFVTGESEFAPAGLEEVRIAPASVAVVDLTGLLRGRVARGVRALRLDATAPVTAALRTRVGRDVSVAVGGEPVTDAAAALPPGAKRLVVAGATGRGVLTWRAWDARGRELAEERTEVDPGTVVRLPLPARAVRLVVEVERASAVAVVEVGPPGLAVLPLAPLVTTSAVPAVRPALR